MLSATVFCVLFYIIRCIRCFRTSDRHQHRREFSFFIIIIIAFLQFTLCTSLSTYLFCLHFIATFVLMLPDLFSLNIKCGTWNYSPSIRSFWLMIFFSFFQSFHFSSTICLHLNMITVDYLYWEIGLKEIDFRLALLLVCHSTFHFNREKTSPGTIKIIIKFYRLEIIGFR